MKTKQNKKVEEYKKKLVEVVIPNLKAELEKAEAIVDEYMALRGHKDQETFRQKFEGEYGVYSPFDYSQKIQDSIRTFELETLPIEKKFFNECFYSDRKAYFCVNEITPNKVEVVEFEITREKDAEPYTQAWEYNYPKDIDKCVKRVLRRTKRGSWKEVGNCNVWYLSDRPSYYYDYEF